MSGVAMLQALALAADGSLGSPLLTEISPTHVESMAWMSNYIAWPRAIIIHSWRGLAYYWIHDINE